MLLFLLLTDKAADALLDVVFPPKPAPPLPEVPVASWEIPLTPLPPEDPWTTS